MFLELCIPGVTDYIVVLVHIKSHHNSNLTSSLKMLDFLISQTKSKDGDILRRESKANVAPTKYITVGFVKNEMM